MSNKPAAPEELNQVSQAHLDRMLSFLRGKESLKKMGFEKFDYSQSAMKNSRGMVTMRREVGTGDRFDCVRMHEHTDGSYTIESGRLRFFGFTSDSEVNNIAANEQAVMDAFGQVLNCNYHDMLMPPPAKVVYTER